MSKYSWLQMILMLQIMQCDDSLQRGQSPSSLKGSMWHTAQYIDYGSGHCICMPQVILFLQKLIPRKKLQEVCYISGRGHPGGFQESPTAEEAYPKNTCDVNGGIKDNCASLDCWLTICVHYNSLKPVLSEENKVARCMMAFHFRDPVDLTKYHVMLDQIHLDEKWFFLTQKKEKDILLPEQKNPKCCIKHKSHITKVMFLCAVACPQFYPCANSWWDGKLGIWPIGDWELAKHKSKNRPRGTLVWKNKAVTKKEVYRELLISKLLLAIIEE